MNDPLLSSPFLSTPGPSDRTSTALVRGKAANGRVATVLRTAWAGQRSSARTRRSQSGEAGHATPTAHGPRGCVSCVARFKLCLLA